MPEIVKGFENLGRQMGDARLRLGTAEDGKTPEAKVEGKMRFGFAGIKDFMQRTQEDKDANKRVAEHLVRGIAEKYGDKVANMASRELSGHIRNGQPLTMRRYAKVMEHADRNMRKLEAQNQALLARCKAETLPQAIDPRLSSGAIIRAITSDPDFRKMEFKNAQELVGYFRDKHQHPARCMPWTSSLDKAPDQKDFGSSLDLGKQITEELKDFALKKQTGPNFPANCLALYSRAKTEIEALKNMGGLSDEQKVERDALVNDLGWLQHTLAGHAGLYDSPSFELYEQCVQREVVPEKTNGVPEGKRQQLEQIQKDARETSEAVRRGDNVNVEERVNHLLENYTRLGEFPDHEPSMRGLVEGLRAETKAAIDALVPGGVQLTPGLVKRYHDGGVPLCLKTLVPAGEKLVGSPIPLSGGKLSTPKDVKIIDQREKITHGVFKSSVKPNEGLGPAGLGLGISMDDAHMSVRNLATKKMDKLCEFSLVPETRYAVVEGELGIVMDFVHGAAPQMTVDIPASDEQKSVYDEIMRNGDEEEKEIYGKQYAHKDGVLMYKLDASVDIDFNDKDLRRDLVKLQLLDALCGQGDRHGGNYIVQLDANGKYSSLKAIDNDQAFGPNFNDPNLLAKGRTAGVLGVGLPQVIDKEMATTFLEMSPESVRRDLAGLLPHDEIEATVQRLRAIQEHIESLPPENIIGKDDWGSEIAVNANSPGEGREQTSYSAREVSDRHRAHVTRSYEEMSR